MKHKRIILDVLTETGICPTLPQKILLGNFFTRFEEKVLPINVQVELKPGRDHQEIIVVSA